MDSLPSNMLLRKDVLARLNISETTFAKWLKSGYFPGPDVALTRKLQYWDRDTLRSFFKKCQDEIDKDIFKGEQYLTMKEVCHQLSIHRYTLYRYMKLGQFPEPDIRISPKRPRWKADTIFNHLKKNNNSSTASV